MLLDTPVASRAARLNHKYGDLDTAARLARALHDPALGRLALVSSFGAESVVLLHLIAAIDRDFPVLFLDTEMLFDETLDYQAVLARDLGLRRVRILRAEPRELRAEDPDATLHRRAPDACCDLRKTRPLGRALRGFDGWITGRKRFQGGLRADLPLFEEDGAGRLKFNPLTDWSAPDLQGYISAHALPRHPLVARGYRSIGCAPCTVAAEGRRGRWAGQDKQECGIHFKDGFVMRNDVSGAPVAAPVAAPGAASVIVTDAGFGPEHWRQGFESIDDLRDAAPPAARAIDVPSDAQTEALGPALAGIGMIRVDFPDFADGRGFSIARQLRRMGFTGRLRARGHLLADQYAMARRAGFDEVEISADLAARQPEAQWRARADWQAHDYQSRLRGWT